MTPVPVVWSSAYEVDIGAHVYPTEKYRLVRERLLETDVVREGHFVEPDAATPEELLRAHTAEWVETVERGTLTPREEFRLEVPFSGALRDAMLLACGGTALALRTALGTAADRSATSPDRSATSPDESEPGNRTRGRVAVHLGGGFHHAFADHGEGFCLLNDVAVAATAVLAEGRAERLAVVDLDVHQGNGTAAIFADEPRVFTLSVHQERNYPFPKPPSDLDLGLDDGTGDEAYLGALREHLPRVFDEHRPDAVLYLAGADPFREDQLGGLALTRTGLRARDELVLRSAREAGTAVAVLLAGGYARRLEDTVGIHTDTVRAAVEAVRASGDDGA